MADATADVLIVGGGVAGATCAAELRARGFDGSILLVGRELDPPYQRPPSSKGLLRGELERSRLALHPDAWWHQQGIELRTRTSVARLDAGERTATLSSRQTVAYGQALLATGAMVRRLNVEGGGLEGIHYLRAPGNAAAIRRDASDRERVVVIGGSYLGCEVAASLASVGHRCTILMQEAEPLERGFGTGLGRWVRHLLEQHGVELIAEDALASYGGEERVTTVMTAAGRRLPADLVVVGAGVTPDVTLARMAGLTLGDSGGIACDARLRSSAEGVWAAGDVCEYDSVVHGRRVRVEHWEAAAAQGRYAAASMLGGAEPFSVVPYFWCELADWATFRSVGPATRWDREVVRGELGSDSGFSVWYLDGDRIAGMVAVGRPADLDAGRALLGSATPVDPVVLGDPRAPLG